MAASRPFCLIASRANWTCTRNCSGVPFDQMGTRNSTLWGRFNFSVEAPESTASWMTSFSGMYGIGGLLRPAFLLHSWGLSPSGATFAWLILRAISPRLVPKNKALKKLLGAPSMGPSQYRLIERSTLRVGELAIVTCGRRTGEHDGAFVMVTRRVNCVRSWEKVVGCSRGGYANGYRSIVTWAVL